MGVGKGSVVHDKLFFLGMFELIEACETEEMMGSKKIVKRNNTGDFLERGEGRQEVYRKDTKAGKKKTKKTKKNKDLAE